MSAVQFNLLPDVKLEYNRTQQTRKVVFTVSAIVISVVVALIVISYLVVNGVQRKLLSDANGNIQSYNNQLKSIPDLDKILTIQNQLNSLPALHQTKHISSRLFNFLTEVTPTDVNVGKISLDTSTNTITMTGTAATVESVNKFVDTLKFTKYFQTSKPNDKHPAFNHVTLTKVDRNDKGAVYTIDASYDPALFSAANNVDLQVPNEVTTRSVINAPNANDLFNGETDKTPEQQGTQ